MKLWYKHRMKHNTRNSSQFLSRNLDIYHTQRNDYQMKKSSGKYYLKIVPLYQYYQMMVVKDLQ